MRNNSVLLFGFVLAIVSMALLFSTATAASWRHKRTDLSKLEEPRRSPVYAAMEDNSEGIQFVESPEPSSMLLVKSPNPRALLRRRGDMSEMGTRIAQLRNLLMNDYIQQQKKYGRKYRGRKNNNNIRSRALRGVGKRAAAQVQSDQGWIIQAPIEFATCRIGRPVAGRCVSW